MAEQLALQQVGRNRRAVDGHERAGVPGAVGVQRLRHQFLAGAGFSQHQHRIVAVGHQADALEDGAHHFAVAEHLFAGLALVCGGGTAIAVALPGAQRARQRLRQRLAADRFGQMVERAQAHGLDGVRADRIGGQHDARHAGRQRWRCAQERQTVVAGQAQVDNRQVDAARFQPPQSGLAAGGLADLIAQVAQGLGQGVAKSGVVIDDQDHGHGSSSTMRVP